jgi:hypothetical protein
MSVTLHISKRREISSQTLWKGSILKVTLKENVETNISAKEMESNIDEKNLAQWGDPQFLLIT